MMELAEYLLCVQTIIRKRCTVPPLKPSSPVLAQVWPAFSQFERARQENSGRLRERIGWPDN